MARMPGATWRPLPIRTDPMSRFDIVCIHTMVGSLDGTDSYFRRSGISSHFGTGGDGRIYQWLDTAAQSGANYRGNHRIISIENADIGPEFPAWNTGDGRAVPAFTPAQIEAIARIVAWACKTHNIPCVLVPDSKPTRRGVGYHRQGVIGYMAPGGEQWSTAVGKVCPGDRRIAQIPQIITRAQQLMGDPVTPPVPDEEPSGMLLIRNSKGTVVLLTDFAVWVPDATSHKGLQAAGVKTAQVADPFFDRLMAMANRDEGDLGAIRTSLAHLEQVVGEWAVRAQQAAPPTS